MSLKPFITVLFSLFILNANSQIEKRQHVFGNAGPNSLIQFIDINNDGFLDFNLSEEEGLYAFLHNGDYSFQSKGAFKIPLISDRLSVSSFAFIDADGDSDQDLIHIGCSACPLREVRVLINTGNSNYVDKGPIYEAFGGFSTDGIVVDDFDNDGDEDFVIIDRKFSKLRFNLVVNDEGNFTGSEVLTIEDFEGFNVQYEDLNNDGVVEILLNDNNNDLHIFSYSNGTFTKDQLIENSGSNFYSYIDINGDGNLDIYHKKSSGLYILQSTESGIYMDEEVLFSGSSCQSAYHLFDIDNDNDLDVLYGKCNKSGVYMYENINGEFIESIQLSSTIDQVIRIYNRDFNNDGIEDLCVLGNDGDLAIIDAPMMSGDNFSHYMAASIDNNLLVNSSPEISAKGVLLYNREWVGVLDKDLNFSTLHNGQDIVGSNFADMDSDGDDDLVVFLNLSSGLEKDVIWLENQNGDFSIENIISSNLNDAEGGITYDFDKDGDLDIVVYSRFNSTKLLSNVDGVYDDSTMGGTASVAFVADVNNDGWMDVLSTDNSGKSYYFPNDKVGGFETRITIPTNDYTDSVTARDFDNDGDLDIAASDIFSEMQIFEFDEGSFVKKASVSGDFGYLTAVDFDLDGDIDIIGSRGLTKFSNNGNFDFSEIGSTSEELYSDILSVYVDDNNVLDLLCLKTGAPRELYLHRNIEGIIDNDNDGFDASVDCDDNNPNAYPGAQEISNNNIDEDCDGIDNTISSTNEQDTNVSIYPNPTTGLISFSYDNKSYNYRIIDKTGRILLSGSLSDQIDISHLSEDLYFISIFSESFIITRKIMLQNKF